MKLLQSLCPNISIVFSTIAFGCWLIIFLFSICNWRWVYYRSSRNLDFWLLFFKILSIVNSCCLFSCTFFLLSFFFFLLSFSLFICLFSFLFLEDFKVFFTCRSDSFFGHFLIGKEISTSSQEAKYSIEESIDLFFLLQNSHQNSIKLFILLWHLKLLL